MSKHATILVRICSLLVGVVLVLAGWGKLTSPGETEQVLALVGLPLPLPKVVMGVLPALELAFGLALLFGLRSRLLYGACLTLLAAFTAFLVVLEVGNYEAKCSCFGKLISSWAGSTPTAGIFRNGILMALLILPTVVTLRERRVSSRTGKSGSGALAGVARLAIPFFIGSALFSLAAHGQVRYFDPWAPDFESPLRSHFTSGLIDEMAQWFEMPEDQAMLLRALHADHKQRFGAFVDEYRPMLDSYDEAYRKTPPATVERVRIEFEREETLAPVADEQAELDAEFFTSIQSILNEEQAARWESFRYWFNRRLWVGRRQVYLEQPLDLIRLLGEFARRTEVDVGIVIPADLRDQYARRTDHALKDLAEYEIEGARRRVRDQEHRLQTDGHRVWIGTSTTDPKQIRFQRDRIRNRRLHEAVRDVNREFHRAIRARLPRDAAEVWNDLYRRAILPKGAQEEVNHLQRLLDLMDQNELGLSTDQTEAIETLLVRHRSQTGLLVRRAIEAQEKLADSHYERTDRAARVELQRAYDASINDLREHDRRTIEMILRALTPEQRALVEAPDPGDGKAEIGDKG